MTAKKDQTTNMKDDSVGHCRLTTTTTIIPQGLNTAALSPCYLYFFYFHLYLYWLILFTSYLGRKTTKRRTWSMMTTVEVDDNENDYTTGARYAATSSPYYLYVFISSYFISLLTTIYKLLSTQWRQRTKWRIWRTTTTVEVDEDDNGYTTLARAICMFFNFLFLLLLYLYYLQVI